MANVFDHLQDVVLRRARYPEPAKVLRTDEVDSTFYIVYAIGWTMAST